MALSVVADVLVTAGACLVDLGGVYIVTTAGGHTIGHSVPIGYQGFPASEGEVGPLHR